MSNAFPFAVGLTNSPWYNVKSSPGKVSFGVGSRILLQGPRNLMRKAIRPLIWGNKILESQEAKEDITTHFYLPMVNQRSDLVNSIWMAALLNVEVSTIWPPMIFA